MRRFFTLFTSISALLLSVSCNDDDWTPRQQINRIDKLISDYPATSDDLRQFISDIENGVWEIDNWITYLNGNVWSTSYSGFTNIAYGKGSQFLDLIFYQDGTCKQCYLYAPAPYNNIPYPYLYTTLLWSFDNEAITIQLTNTDYQAAGSPYAQTTLKLRYYRYGEFIMDGLQPSAESLNGYTIRYIGDIEGAQTRSEYENKFKDETIFASQNGEAFR